MRHWKVFLGLTLILAFADYVPAQTGLTSLRGTVTDPAGAVVPGARVELKNNATGSHATATTDSNGAYEFPQIPPGRYTLTATMTGFTSVKTSMILAGAVLGTRTAAAVPSQGHAQTNRI